MKTKKLYNILFPLWMLVWVPSFLWLFLIPANYLIDRFVFLQSLKCEDKKVLCEKLTWKICSCGFLADFAGALLMLGITILLDNFNAPFINDLVFSVQFNPFENVLAFFVVCICISFSGYMIYFLDRRVLLKGGLSQEQAIYSAKMLAIYTAPYLFLFPSILFYK